MKTALKPRKPGRPKSANPRAETLLLKLTQEELAVINERAKRAEKVRAEWIRDMLLSPA